MATLYRTTPIVQEHGVGHVSAPMGIVIRLVTMGILAEALLVSTGQCSTVIEWMVNGVKEKLYVKSQEMVYCLYIGQR